MSTSATNPLTPLAFSGVSTYSSDFQSVLQRAVQIAQLPITALQNQNTTLQEQDQALTTIDAPVSALGSAISALATLGTNQALSASSSAPLVVSAEATGATAPATYTISNITSIASAASETTLTGYADANSTQVSSNGNLTLTVGSKTYPITLTSATNNLAGLQAAINNLGAGVTASILTTGNSTNPDYLAVSANNTGATTLTLTDKPTSGASVNLLTSKSQGSNANFELNGISVSQTSNTINSIVPGLTLNILGTTAANQNVTVSLASDSSQLSSALQTFVADYNSLQTAVSGQVGQSGGPLAGDILISQIESALSQTATYNTSGSAAIKSLAGLGITIDDSGQMNFNQGTFDSLTSAQISSAFQFLGSSTSGFGALSQSFTAISDPVSGMIATEQKGISTETQQITAHINTLNDQLTTMQNNLTSQLETADAGIAKLQNQQTVLTASIQAVDLSLFGQNYGTAMVSA
jgi:flagellar hook-associated protein 2